ncbi:MAG: 50S ribosomal protein L14e [Candidatus Diapherotrites archaeon]|nr:50S ribosomal protein L14e [Candidatus Diapherotrites archaeon]MDZ4256023.1 50S ribosomal protein L14e [archaeon]
MTLFEIGRVCYKSSGRDAGKKIVVVGALKDGFVLAEGARTKRKCNVRHLIPTEKKVKLAADYTHKDITDMLKGN